MMRKFVVVEAFVQEVKGAKYVWEQPVIIYSVYLKRLNSFYCLCFSVIWDMVLKDKLGIRLAT